MTWVSVYERMPPPWAKPADENGHTDATVYLVTDGETVWTEERWIKGFARDCGREMFGELPITHWMPIEEALPVPPGPSRRHDKDNSQPSDAR